MGREDAVGQKHNRIRKGDVGMKKAIAFVLVLALLGALAGCAVDTGIRLEESQQAGVSSNRPEEPSVGHVFVTTLESYEEYCDFIENEPDLSEDFIYYEDGLDELGSFCFLGIMSREEGHYILVDKNGYELYVEFAPKEWEDLSKAKKPTKVSLACDTFLKIDEDILNELPKFNEISSYRSDSDRYYTHDNLVYIYGDSGECCAVKWMTNNHTVTVSARTNNDGSFSNYPMDGEETFVSRLLTVETAQEAVREFNEKVFGDAAPLQGISETTGNGTAS